MSLSRRAWLRGAGATLALPLLESLAPRAFGQSAPAVPPRLVIFETGEGTLLQRWTPQSLANDALQLSELLQPLAPFQNKLTVVSGLENKLPRYHSSNGHNAPGHTLLCANLVETSADSSGNLLPMSAWTEVQQGSQCVGPSVDHFLAQKLGITAPLNLAIGNSDPAENRMFYQVKAAGTSGPNPQAPLYNDPVSVFQQRLAGLPAGATTRADRFKSRRTTVLDSVRGALTSLGQKVSTADRQRLVDHAARIQSLEQTLSYVPPVDCSGLMQNLPAGFPSSTPGWKADWSNDDLYYKAQLDVAVQVLSCGASQIVTLQDTLYDGPTFDWLSVGPVTGWHAQVHGDQGGTPNDNAVLKGGFSYYADRFAYLLGQLDAIVEPNGKTLLDNSLVLWISEFGNGSVHSTANLPVVLAGGLLQGNRHLDGTGYTSGDLFTSILGKFGVDGTGFGFQGDSDLNHGGVPGL